MDYASMHRYIDTCAKARILNDIEGQMPHQKVPWHHHSRNAPSPTVCLSVRPSFEGERGRAKVDAGRAF